MLKKLKFKFARFLLLKKYKKNNGFQLYNEFFSKSEYFFIIMPERVSYVNTASEVVKYLIKHNKEVTVLIKEDLIKMTTFHDKVKLIKYSELDQNFFGLPKKELISQLKIKKYETAIDLNLDYSLFLYGVVCYVNADIRVGFQKKDAESFYNLVLSSSSQKPEYLYEYLIKTLNMFG